MSSVLFDTPGPRSRRRHLIGSVIGVIALIGIVVWVFLRLQKNGALEPETWEVLSYPAVWEALGRGLVATLKAAALAAVLAVLLGALMTALHLAPTRWLSVPAKVYIELFRGLPVLLLMFFPIAMFTSMTYFTGVVIGLALYNSAIIAEILRSGVTALPSGQREAGLAIGLTPTATLRLVEFPQAVRIMLPSLVSQVVVLLKDTSLGYVITYEELLQTVRQLKNYYATTFGSEVVFPIFFTGAAIYILVNMTLSQVANWLARRGSKKAAGAPRRRADVEANTAGG